MSELTFGIMLPQGWLKDLALIDYSFIVKVARKAEEKGFDSVWAYDHLMPYHKYSSIEDPMLECWTLLSSLIGVTSRIRLGQVVTCNSYRNPALLAKIGSTLDFLSNGRLEFGIGAGWYEEEYNSFGYEFPKASARIEQLDEALQIIKSMWSKGKARLDGKHYRVDAINNPMPRQKPHPPIMVGGTGNKLLKVVAKHADIYNYPFGTPKEIKERAEVLKEECNAIKRDFKEIKLSVLIRAIVGEDDQVREIIEKLRGNESVDEYLQKIREDTLLGTEDTSAMLKEYIDVGVTHFIIHLYSVEDSIDALARIIREIKS